LVFLQKSDVAIRVCEQTQHSSFQAFKILEPDVVVQRSAPLLPVCEVMGLNLGPELAIVAEVSCGFFSTTRKMLE
jgi:hypothetical protein